MSRTGQAYEGYLRDPLTGMRIEEADAYLPQDDDGVHLYPVPQYDLSRTPQLPPRNPMSQGLFRFQSLLPVDATGVVSLGEGDTALVPLTGLGADLDMHNLFLKDESRNPTWSYKDRLAAVAVTKAAQQGRDTVVVSSTGNHGAAVAAYAAKAGMRCIVLTLESVPEAMKTLIQSYGAIVVALKEPAQRWTVMRQAIAERGWVPMSGFVSPPSGSNPFGVEGYKTIAYELYEQLGERVPDVVVTPVAYGDGLAGILRGFTDLVELGLADAVPRMVAAEPFGPYGAALRDGFVSGATVPSGPSVAFSIASPMATWQGWNALVQSLGAAAAAGDDETMRAQATLAAGDGIFLEASSAITAAVLPKLIEEGSVDRDETVVLLGTSTGLKDVATTAARLHPVPVIEPTMGALDREIEFAQHSADAGAAR